MINRDAASRSGRSIHAFVMRHASLRQPASWLSRWVASAPESSAVVRLLGPVRDWARGSIGAEDVIQVARLLEEQGVPFYLAGGWGVDALAGRQTRSHRDLDVVVDHYDENLDAAVDALAPLGFRLVASYKRRAWMPHNTVLEDDTGRNIDLDSLNWDILAEAFGAPGSDSATRPEFEHRVLARGTVGGDPVPCLSADVQLLYHRLFELKAHQRHDVRILRHELGAWIPDPPPA